MSRLVGVLVWALLSGAYLGAPLEEPPVRPADDAFDAILRGSAGGAAIKGQPRAASATQVSAPRVRYAWRTACDRGVGQANGGGPVCPTNTCEPGENQYRLWRVAPPPVRPMGLVCSGNGPPPIAAVIPQVTEAMVLQAFRRIPLPSLRSQSQPANKTLINFDTIFFTQAEPLTRQVTLLGQNVRLEIQPTMPGGWAT